MIIALVILSVGIKSCKIRLDGHKNSVFCIEREKATHGKINHSQRKLRKWKNNRSEDITEKART